MPHEHRRELRALRVFGAWTNLTDIKAKNTIDTVATENGKTIVKHYLQDVGSTFGMCNGYYEWDLELRDLPRWALAEAPFTLGFGLSPWQTVDYVEHPSVGKFEGKEFDPKKWRPQTPTTAYMELRDDDAFWAARRIAAFTDDLIRAAVHTGQFSDPEAEKYLADALIQRREKIKAIYLDAGESDCRSSPRCERPDVRERGGRGRRRAGHGRVPGRVDDVRQRDRPDQADRGHASTATTTIAAPSGLPSSGFVAVDIAAESAGYPSWKQPVRAYFRQDGGSWKLVGLERMPDKPQPAPGQKASR